MIPFNKPYITGNENIYIDQVLRSGRLSGDGFFTTQCSSLIEKITGSKKVLLTPSCSAALELAAIILDIKTGDEVIMPSYTFVSTANAFVLRGAEPVFIDINETSKNIDVNSIEAAITDKTVAICVVHYAGLPCEMTEIMNIAKKYNLYVIEDNAQGLMSKYKGKPLGSIGDLGCISFHETKNIVCGEGGAIQINNEKLIEKAEVIREKGTNRSQFFRGQIDKYTWINHGSSYLLGEINAACLMAQLEEAEGITQKRLEIWNAYHDAFSKYEDKIKLPHIENGFEHNAHLFFLEFDNLDLRSLFIEKMKAGGIQIVFHYAPLHSSPYGKKFHDKSSDLKNTSNFSDCMVRLPLYPDVNYKKIIKQSKLILDTL